jgi:DNA-directed RNA polymerase specialized sigma24 family protein
VEGAVRRREVSAEDVEQVLRLHADRVHDAARRLGVGTGSAVDVVRQSALALVRAVAEHPERVPDAAGWWFAEVRRLSRGAAPDTADVPLGGGLLAVDRDQIVLAETLEDLDEDQRLAVLMRDAYRLPWPTVAAGLQTTEDAAGTTVFRARAAAVPLLDDEPAPQLPDHATDLAGLARLGEGAVAPRDATLRRHVQACRECAAVVASQERVHLLMSGLAVDALPAGERDAVLAQTEAAARDALPPAASLVLSDEEWEEWEAGGRRVLPPVLAALGVLAAVLLGTVLGVVLSRGASAVLPVSSDVLPAPTLPPVQAPAPISLPSNLPPPPPVSTPRTSVFTLAPRTTAPAPPPTTAPPTSAPTPSASASTAGTPAIALSPSSGRVGDTVTVSGTSWAAGARVVIDYLDAAGRPTGSRATAFVAGDGTFTTSLTIRDSSGVPGRRTVRATDGTSTATASFDETL